MKMMFAYVALMAAFFVPFGPQPARAGAKPIVEIAFVLDTTGSMGPLIEGAKQKIWSIATAIIDANPNAEIRMALVAYRDIGDAYVTKKFDLTTDLQELYGELLSFRAQGGGDWAESVNEALDVAVTKLNWSQDRDICKILFLVGDAPPHMDYQQDRKYPEVIADARARGIIVNAVQAGVARDTERVWREIAQRGDGKYLPIPQDGGKVVIIETPYDRDIIILQNDINRTVIPYGKVEQQRRVKTNAARSEEAPAPTATDIASYLIKRAGPRQVITSDGDLVADAAAGRVKIEAVPEAELPDNLKKLPPKERQAEVDRQSAARKALDEKLAALVKKRDQFVADARKNQPANAKKDSFDQVVEETLKAQVKRAPQMN